MRAAFMVVGLVVLAACAPEQTLPTTPEPPETGRPGSAVIVLDGLHHTDRGVRLTVLGNVTDVALEGTVEGAVERTPAGVWSAIVLSNASLAERPVLRVQVPDLSRLAATRVVVEEVADGETFAVRTDARVTARLVP